MSRTPLSFGILLFVLRVKRPEKRLTATKHRIELARNMDEFSRFRVPPRSWVSIVDLETSEGSDFYAQSSRHGSDNCSENDINSLRDFIGFQLWLSVVDFLDESRFCECRHEKIKFQKPRFYQAARFSKRRRILIT